MATIAILASLVTGIGACVYAQTDAYKAHIAHNIKQEEINKEKIQKINGIEIAINNLRLRLEPKNSNDSLKSFYPQLNRFKFQMP